MSAPQKRKGGSAPPAAAGAQQPASKKAKQQAGSDAQPKQAQAQAKQQGKKGGKAAAPEPQEEEEDEGEDVSLGSLGGEVDDAALALIATVEPEWEAINEQMVARDQQMQAEIYAVQKKHMLAKRPLMAKRDQLLTKVPTIWKTLLTSHQTFAVQLEDIDRDLLDQLSGVEVREDHAPPEAKEQQVLGVTITFTFRAGGKNLVKPGKVAKKFTFDDKTESLVCVPVASADLPFVSKSFVKEHKDSFFANWFTSEGADDGVLAAQDALSSELYVDPLQLYKHVAEGGTLEAAEGEDDDDDDDVALQLGDDDEEEDEEAPQLAGQ